MIDTHCHLDAGEFSADRSDVLARARQAGVSGMVIPAVDVDSLDSVCRLARDTPGVAYAAGIHPLYVRSAADSDLERLADWVAQHASDPKLVAIGEIGLDYFAEGHHAPEQRVRQEHFYAQQLRLARQFGLPVLLHGRKAQDRLLKYLRQVPVGGIAHAFNGSFQQARQFLGQGLALGMGGALTYERARQIRRLATQLPLSAYVLETDAPDMPPAWLHAAGRRPDGMPGPLRNEPAQVARIAQEFAHLRDMPVASLIAECAVNAQRVLPRLATLLRQESLLHAT